ncbi:MAG: cytochrome c maturation protein CcmE [Gammaproteobacteria bacterium]
MRRKRKQRLYFIICLLFAIVIAVALVLVALRQNINLFYTPSQIVEGEAPINRIFRVGGLVKTGSVQRNQHDLHVIFVLTDTANEITVNYNGILPDLFREGQGIVAQGRLAENKVFIAQEVLAKHDENYMPPEVQHSLDQAQHKTTRPHQ